MIIRLFGPRYTIKCCRNFKFTAHGALAAPCLFVCRELDALCVRPWTPCVLPWTPYCATMAAMCATADAILCDHGRHVCDRGRHVCYRGRHIVRPWQSCVRPWTPYALPWTQYCAIMAHVCDRGATIMDIILCDHGRLKSKRILYSMPLFLLLSLFIIIFQKF